MAELLTVMDCVCFFFQASYILPRFADALELCNVSRKVLDPVDVRQVAAAQQGALLKWAWNGNWFSRAWLPNMGFVGTDSPHDPIGMQLEPQGWPLMVCAHLHTFAQSTARK